MGNHAGNFNVNNLKWFGGLLDSDGCVSITTSKRKNGRVVYTPCITITNSNIYIVETVHNLLVYYNINHHIKKNGSCKNICITRPTIIDTLCRLIYDKVLVKCNELQLIHQFCLSRIQNVSEAGCNWKAVYTEEEIELVKRLSQLNKIHYGECIEYGISENVVRIDILNLFSLDWLSGFIDGDGCITINKMKRTNKTYYQYQPMVHIVTGSPIAKNIITIYLDRYNIDYYLKKTSSGVKHKPNCIKKKFEFYIRSLKNCVVISNLIKNKLCGKKQRCLKLLEFCYSRLNNKNKPYSNYEIELYEWIHNDIKDPPTTTSKTSFDEDIV